MCSSKAFMDSYYSCTTCLCCTLCTAEGTVQMVLYTQTPRRCPVLQNLTFLQKQSVFVPLLTLNFCCSCKVLVLQNQLILLFGLVRAEVLKLRSQDTQKSVSHSLGILKNDNKLLNFVLIQNAYMHLGTMHQQNHKRNQAKE